MDPKHYNFRNILRKSYEDYLIMTKFPKEEIENAVELLSDIVMKDIVDLSDKEVGEYLVRTSAVTRVETRTHIYELDGRRWKKRKENG